MTLTFRNCRRFVIVNPPLEHHIRLTYPSKFWGSLQFARVRYSHDADGQRILTTRHDGTKVYTPFPDYEVEVPTSGATTTRTTYRIAGQMVAVQTKLSTGASTFYYTYTDHLGNVAGLSSTAGAFIANSVARHDPFGNYRTTPATTTNPAITDHGFTGHRMNNTGGYPTQNVGLIYMNARYYLPEVGRFISADSIVPDPSNPQSYNRYSYVHNSPMNYTDPSGHCIDATSGDVHMNQGPYGTSGLCTETQYDMTDWLVTEMVSNVNSSEIDDMNAVLDQPLPINMSGPFVVVVDTRYLQMLTGPFYQINKTNGLWDFKQKMEDLGGGVVLCGNGGCFWVGYSTPGNIHYGYVAAAMGVPKPLSQAAGGALELTDPNGDPGGLSTLFENPEDWVAVNFGYDLYDSFGDDLTLAEFQSALTTDVGEAFEQPPINFEPPWAAKPQANHYPLGFFDFE